MITLTEARAALVDSVLHVGTSSYDNTKLDRAILAAGREFNRETNCITEIITVSFAANESERNMVSQLSVTTWNQDQFMWAYHATTLKPLKLVTHASILRRRSADDTTAAAATMIAFISSEEVAIYPKSSGNQSIKIKRRVPFVAITPGEATPANVTINIPDEWVYSVLWKGAKYHLLSGAPGHPDAETAGKEWRELLVTAKQHYPDGRPGTDDRDVHPSIARGVRGPVNG